METFNQIVLYFFSPTPPRSFGYFYLCVALVVLLIIGALAMHLYRKKHKDDKAFKKLFRPWPGRLFILAVILALHLAARVNGLPIFSTRILLFILLAAILWSVFRIGKDWAKEYPRQKAQRKQRMEKNRYIPKKHKK